MGIYGNFPVHESKTDKIVRDELIKEGYSKDLRLVRYLLDNDKLCYHIFNPITYNGKNGYILREIDFFEYMEYLRRFFENNDTEVINIHTTIKNKQVLYYISTRPINRKLKKVR